MNTRRIAIPSALIAVAVALMGAYYGLFYRASFEAADYAATMQSASGLAAQQLELVHVDEAVRDARAARAVRVVLDADLLLVDAAAPLAHKVEISGRALHPRDSRHFIEHAESLELSVEELAAMIARQFANVDTLRLDGRNAPPIRLANLVVDRAVPRQHLIDAVRAARLAGTQTVLLTVATGADIGHVEWPAERDEELASDDSLESLVRAAAGGSRSE